MQNEILGSVEVTPTKVRPGGSAKVEVFSPSGKSYENQDDVNILINGAPGSLQYLQFSTLGEKKLLVLAYDKKITEQTEAVINVEGDPLVINWSEYNQVNPKIAMLCMKQSYGRPYEVTFLLGSEVEHNLYQKNKYLNREAQPSVLKSSTLPMKGKKGNLPFLSAKEKKDLYIAHGRIFAKYGRSMRQFASETASFYCADLSELTKFGSMKSFKNYEWDFGDGNRAVTTLPTVTHNYFHALDSTHENKQFHVRCRVLDEEINITRTLTIHSTYVLCKRLGTIVPHTTSNTFAVWLGHALCGEMTVHNIEETPLTITHQAVVMLSEKPNDLSVPTFRKLKTPIILPPKSVTIMTVPFLTANAPGYAVYYAGHNEQGLQVRFSHTFDITMKDQQSAWTVSLIPEINYKLITKESLTKKLSRTIKDPFHPLEHLLINSFADKATGTAAISINAPPGYQPNKLIHEVSTVLHSSLYQKKIRG